MIQDSDFVRWSSAFYHVLVFTVKTREGCLRLFFKTVLYTHPYSLFISFPLNEFIQVNINCHLNCTD